MLYQAYQAHCDIMGPLRALAPGAISGDRRPWSGCANTPAAAQSHRRLRADLARRADPQRPPFGIDTVTVGNREVAVTEEAALHHAVRHAAALPEGHRAGAAARAAGGAAVRPFRDPAAQHRAHDAAGARRLHHRLAQRARRPAGSAARSASTICRPAHPISRGDRTGRARDRGLPALRCGADRSRRHGGRRAIRPSRAA